MPRDRASALEAEETAEETPKKGVSEKFKKKVLELFDKFNNLEMSIPNNLKNIQDIRTLFKCTYKCTKFYQRNSNHKLKVGTTREDTVCKEDLINDCIGSWEKFDEYINNEEEYLKNINKDCFEYDEYTSTLCLEGEIMDKKERILKWHAEEEGWLHGISEGDFCSQGGFYKNLKFAAFEKNIIPGPCIKYEYGDYKDWERCLPPSTFTMYGIDPQFIFDEMWRSIIIAEPFNCEDNICRRCPSTFTMYGIDPQFIFDEIWGSIIIAEPFNCEDNISYIYDDDYYFDGFVLQEGGIWFAHKFFFDKIFDETEPHKKKAWRSAREALLNITTPILSVEDVKNVKGIGKASLAFVEELLEQRKKNYFWKKMEEARMEYEK
jgi:hypothetical protein